MFHPESYGSIHRILLLTSQGGTHFLGAMPPLHSRMLSQPLQGELGVPGFPPSSFPDDRKTHSVKNFPTVSSIVRWGVNHHPITAPFCIYILANWDGKNTRGSDIQVSCGERGQGAYSTLVGLVRWPTDRSANQKNIDSMAVSFKAAAIEAWNRQNICGGRTAEDFNSRLISTVTDKGDD